MVRLYSVYAVATFWPGQTGRTRRDGTGLTGRQVAASQAQSDDAGLGLGPLGVGRRRRVVGATTAIPPWPAGFAWQPTAAPWSAPGPVEPRRESRPWYFYLFAAWLCWGWSSLWKVTRRFGAQVANRERATATPRPASAISAPRPSAARWARCGAPPDTGQTAQKRGQWHPFRNPRPSPAHAVRPTVRCKWHEVAPERSLGTDK